MSSPFVLQYVSFRLPRRSGTICASSTFPQPGAKVLSGADSCYEYGVNYEKTFAPDAKMTIVRTILPGAASQSLPLCRWTSRLRSYIVILRNVYTRSHHLGFSQLLLLVYVSFGVLSMVSNKLLGLGLTNSEPLYCSFPSSRVSMILPCFFEKHMSVLWLF